MVIFKEGEFGTSQVYVKAAASAPHLYEESVTKGKHRRQAIPRHPPVSNIDSTALPHSRLDLHCTTEEDTSDEDSWNEDQQVRPLTVATRPSNKRNDFRIQECFPSADNATNKRSDVSIVPTGIGSGYTSSGIDRSARTLDYDPLHFIRCHARGNDPKDSETKVWHCAFEPLLPNMEEAMTDKDSVPQLVASCGGESVCLIDCGSGKVVKRYKHIGEEFISLAWTTVTDFEI